MESTDRIKINQLTFRPFLDFEEIYIRVKEMSKQINQDYQGKNPLIIVLMNGAFMFASDLLRHLDFLPNLHFIKTSSYHELESTGDVKIQSLNDIDLSGSDILIIEDIIDTGATLNQLLNVLFSKGAANIEIASLLLKPRKLKHDIKAKYIGFEISDEFVVGYGLDYNNVGRNLPHIYQLEEQNINLH
jgi:hypoxanthine phosphoribosyltransferase